MVVRDNALVILEMAPYGLGPAMCRSLIVENHAIVDPYLFHLSRHFLRTPWFWIFFFAIRAVP